MARWARAQRALQLPPHSKVLDLGCAFGFGTRLLVNRYRAFGHDLSEDYIARARRAVPAALFTAGPADDVPYPTGFFDGVLLLDVLEHVPDEQTVIDEVARVLRPGGRLVLTVPNRGALAGLDSLNLYRHLHGDRAPAPTDDPSWPLSPTHRHYSKGEVERLLGGEFCPVSVGYTGVGLAEPVNLLLLLLVRPKWPRLFALLQYLYFGLYVVEDLILTGAWGYHLTVVADRRSTA